MALHNELGRWGEDLAVRMLEAKGYRIVERDWKDCHRDIDIIAIDNGCLVFVEVKTRRSGTLLTPEQAVDRRKIKNITIAANRYVKSQIIDLPLRFDIVAITGTDESTCKIEYRGCFYALLFQIVEECFYRKDFYNFGRIGKDKDYRA